MKDFFDSVQVQGLAQFVALTVSSHQYMALTDTVLLLRIPTDKAAERRHSQVHKISDAPSHLHFHVTQFGHTFLKYQHERFYLSSSRYSRKFTKILKTDPRTLKLV